VITVAALSRSMTSSLGIQMQYVVVLEPNVPDLGFINSDFLNNKIFVLERNGFGEGLVVI
jgi:hypothetical protein